LGKGEGELEPKKEGGTDRSEHKKRSLEKGESITEKSRSKKNRVIPLTKMSGRDRFRREGQYSCQEHQGTIEIKTKKYRNHGKVGRLPYYPEGGGKRSYANQGFGQLKRGRRERGFKASEDFKGKEGGQTSTTNRQKR